MLLVSMLAVGCSPADTNDPPLSPVSTPSTSLMPVSSPERSPSPSPSPVPSAAARDRLFALGDGWFGRGATVVYDTVGALAGQSTSTHQCLRMMAERGMDRESLLQMCNRQGTLELTWDPPRWQMDVTTPLNHFAVFSSPRRTRICEGGDPHACRVVSLADAIAESGVDVFFRRPDQILDEIAATEVTAIESPDDAVVPVECFAASGPDEHVEWCFGADGVLVSFLRYSGGTGWESVEATDVSDVETD